MPLIRCRHQCRALLGLLRRTVLRPRGWWRWRIICRFVLRCLRSQWLPVAVALQAIPKSAELCPECVGLLRMLVREFVLPAVEIGERNVVVRIQRVGIDRESSLEAFDSGRKAL